jgi:hypothetical protein
MFREMTTNGLASFRLFGKGGPLPAVDKNKKLKKSEAM